jgi:putative transposase
MQLLIHVWSGSILTCMKAARPRHRQNYNQPGDAHELTFCCYHRYKFLQAERTAEWLKQAIDEARAEFDFAVWAYVFMPEHAHLIVWPRRPKYEIADIRKAIKEPVGRKGIAHIQVHAPEWLPRVTRQRGKRIERMFWLSGGGFDRNITDGETRLRMIEYIHLNPVRRGLVERVIDWKWSSAAWYVLGRPTPIAVDPIPPEWL